MIAVTALVVVGLRQQAAGTAELISAVPAADARLADPPATVTLTFPGTLDPAATHVEVTGPDGTAYTSGTSTVDEDTVRQPVAITGEGPVLVTYHGVLAGGDVVAGQYEFVVGEPVADEPPGVAAGGHSHGGTGPLSSLVALAIVIAGLGVLVLAFALPPRAR